MNARTGRLVAATTLLLLLAGCAGSASDSGGDEQAGAGEAMSVSEPEAALAAPEDAARAAEDGAAAGEVVTGGVASVAAATRSIVYRVDLTVQLEDVAAATARATTLTETAGGYVESESTSGDGVEDGPRTATLVLRVPVDRHAAVVTDLSELGTVVFRERSAQDVTEEVVDVASRITSQRASLVRLRALLDDAGSLSDVVTLEREIASREAELDSLLRRQKQLAGLSELATITVTFAQPGSATLVDDPPERGFLAGLEAGWEAFTAAVAVVLTVLGAVIPFVAVALVLGLPLVAWWRRRRAGRRAGGSSSAEPHGTASDAEADLVPAAPGDRPSAG